MSASAKPARLWKRPSRRDKVGRVTHAATWVILDRGRQYGTGCNADDLAGAQAALTAYLNKRHERDAVSRPRRLEEIPVADVLNLYARDVAAISADPRAEAHRIERLGRFFAGKTLADINGPLARAYASGRNDSTAQRDLKTLSAAIGHHLAEGLHTAVVKVWKPKDRAPRDRWLTRSEAARLLKAAWKPYRRHIARFILVGLYTGSRASVIAKAALQRQPGCPYLDTETGIYHRRPEGERETNKRKPNVPLPPRLLAHVRRWKRLGQRYVVEWDGGPVLRVSNGFKACVKEAGLDGKVVPHTLRHTAATWLMQRGANAWQAAGFLGMSVKTLEKNYGHHHPDHFDSVHQAFYWRSNANGLPKNAVNQ